MEKLVETLPAGERVISFADLPDDDERGNGSMSGGKLTHLTEWVLTHLVGGLQGNHLLSRACIGHCFDYANYEPSTGQFRVHALPGNPVVLASNAEVGTVESGTYVAKTGDLPLYALIRCGPAPGDIIMEPMTVGESRSTLACPGTRSDSGK
jgi:hypothetical protein